MNTNDTKALMESVYRNVKNKSGLDFRNPKQYLKMLAEQETFAKHYMRPMAEAYTDPEQRRNFLRMAVNTRNKILAENTSTGNISPYETLAIPILSNFYPKLIAKELVNVVPIDKPEVMIPYIYADFSTYEPNEYSGYNYEFPEMDKDISGGPRGDMDLTGEADTGSETNIITSADGANFDSSKTLHVQKDFVIVGVEKDGTGEVTEFTDPVRPTVDGNIYANIEHADGHEDIISGHINYSTGKLFVASNTSGTDKVVYTCTISLEQNNINPKVRIRNKKIDLRVKSRKIQGEWTPEAEQDANALYSISLQSEIINAMGEQVALDIDREIVDKLFETNDSRNPDSHTDTFDRKPREDFLSTEANWYQDITRHLNQLSAQVYNTTMMGSANTIAANPVDAAILENLNSFEYLGRSDSGGEAGYRTATVQGGKWKVLTSNVVPEGKMLVKYRNSDPLRASMFYAPYVPAMLMPYPQGNLPVITIMSRYATRVVRHGAVSVLNITDSRETT